LRSQFSRRRPVQSNPQLNGCPRSRFRFRFRVLRDYERAWRARDPAALATLFAEDGFVLSNGRLPVRGRDAIRAAYAEGGGPLVLRALAYAIEGSVGYIIGAYGSGQDAGDTGKFVLALQRASDGRWLIAADIDNANQRPRPSP